MEGKIRYSIEDISISRVPLENFCLGDFTCGVASLDAFFHSEMQVCQKYKYLTAYCVKDMRNKEILGLFTLSNDNIIIRGADKEDFIEEMSLLFEKDYSWIFGDQTSFPAVNIGHLAIRSSMQDLGIGTFVISYLIQTFLRYDIAGCQFLTVDSLNNSETNKFYLRNGVFQSDRFGYDSRNEKDVSPAVQIQMSSESSLN